MIFILTVVAYLFLLIWPVRFAARAVGAGREGIFACVIAMFVVSAASGGMFSLGLGGDALTTGGVFIAFFVVSAAIYMLFLDTTFKGGFIITLVQIVMSTVLLFVFRIVVHVLFPELKVVVGS